MTAPHIVDPAGLLGEALAEASPDLMRQLLQTMINALLSADADAVVGAEYGRPDPARTAQRNGYRRRPLDTRVGTIDVIDLHLARYDRIAQRFDRDQRAGTSFLKAGIDTRDPGYNALIDRIERVAVASSAPILLTGPTGAGKSRLARRIYELKRTRRQISGPLCEVNCATLRGDQVSSALFGHRRGSFTGATSDRPGLLMAANGGMLFLDEIGELGLDEQAMLLRAIEEGRFLPVGADRNTIAGLCMSLAQAIPQAGERLTTEDGTVLEIVEASARRVRKVRIHPVPHQGDGLAPEPGDHDD